MTGGDLERIEQRDLARPTAGGALTVGELVANKRKIQEVMRAVMREGVHYGKVSGCPKPSLWQPGAETLFSTFGLAPDLEVEDLSTVTVGPGAWTAIDEIRYRVMCRVRHVASGEIVGMGIGEASSNEEKYRWRAAVCDEEFDATLDARRRVKFKKNRGGTVEQIKQVRTEPADIANTVLKMAGKRARVDGAKSTCAASDVFEQDIEDLDGVVDLERGTAEPVTEPRATPAASAPAATDDDSGFTFAADAWQRAVDTWHDKGAISDKQSKRLFAIAYGNDWTNETIVQAIRENLNCEVDALPWGDPYNAVVGIFETFKPADMLDDPPPSAEAPADAGITEDDIPF